MVIIILTQYVFYHHIFWKIQGYSLQMDEMEFAFILFNTLIITFSGYVINDYFDFETDLINKKRTALNDYPLSKKSLKGLYICLSIIICFCAIYYGWYYEKLSRSLIFLIVHVLLFLYSYRLKLYPLVGNVCVALLSALVVFILYFFENSLWPFPEYYWLKPVYFIGVFYFLFAFVLSFVRELVKDIEDMEGDKRSGARTFPILVGTNKTLDLIILSLCVLGAMTYLLLILFFGKLKIMFLGILRKTRLCLEISKHI